MHMAIDILVGIILIFFLLAGWHKGMLLSVLNIMRIFFAYGVAYLSGKHIGFWLGEATQRPRMVTVPVVAIFTFALVHFIFHIIITEIRDNRKMRIESSSYQLALPSRIGGGLFNLGAGSISLVLIFWLVDLFLVGSVGYPVPGAEKSHFARYARQGVYEVFYRVGSAKGDASQASTFALMISNPDHGMEHLEKILSAPSVKQLIIDRQLTEDIISGDPQRIEENPSLQRLFSDKRTLNELRELGLLSGKEKKKELCKKLSHFGSNENIRASIERLKDKDLLQKDKMKVLVRDPDFDQIIAELMK